LRASKVLLVDYTLHNISKYYSRVLQSKAAARFFPTVTGIPLMVIVFVSSKLPHMSLITV